MWRNDFIDFDDGVYITKNDYVKGGLTVHDVAWAWTTFHGGYYIPLTWISFQIDAGLFPLDDAAGGALPNPAVFHAQNLFWHTATVLLLFVVLRRMTGAFWPSAVVAALFAVHPLHVESVAWATERKDVLSTFFWVLTMLGYYRWTQTRTPAFYVAMLSAFVLGMLAKPMLVTLPFALLLLDFWPLRRLRWPRAVMEKLPLFALAAGASWLAVVSQRHAEAVVSLEHMPFSARLANAIVSAGWYLEKTFWPTQLAIFYPHPGPDWTWPAVLAAGAVLLAVTLTALLLARRMPWLIVGWLWFLGTLVPVIGLVQVGVQARGDRFVYVPHIGLFVAVVWTAADLLSRLRLPAAVPAGLTGLCVVALAAVAWVQVGTWRDTETLWHQALAATTNNHRAHTHLTRYLSQQATRETTPEAVRNRLRQAREHAEQAVALKRSAEQLYNLGVACLWQGELDEAEKAFAEATTRDAHHAHAWHNLGMVCLRQGGAAQLTRAVQAFEHALDLQRQAPVENASYSERDRGIANTLANLGLGCWQLSRRERAMLCWNEALQCNAKEAVALNGQGLLLLRQGQFSEAIDRFTSAVQANPGLAQAYSNLGVAQCRLDQWSADRSHATAIALEETRLSLLTEKGRTFPSDLALYRRRRAFTLRAFSRDEDAAREYREALRLDPSWPRRCLAEAWDFAANSDPAQRDAPTAVELASQVCQASEQPSAEALDALAAAQAAAGRFSEAVKTARQALAKAEPRRAREIQHRLALYEQGKAYVREAQGASKR
jgi:tetratricopeptide (TPR) repeat protein